MKVDKLKTMPGATLNLNINKGTSRNTVSVKRSSVRGWWSREEWDRGEREESIGLLWQKLK